MRQGAEQDEPATGTRASGRASPLARIFARLALLLVSLALALLAIEGALAALGEGGRGPDSWRSGSGYHVADPELIYAPRPGASHVLRKEEFTERVRINSLGLRDEELLPRAEVDLRIVVVGDSMTFGHGVQGDEAYPNALERLLREREPGRVVEVVNAGVKGYGTDQYHALFLRRLRGLEPDLLIVGYYQNDVFDNVLHPLYRLEEGALVPLDPTRDELYRIGSRMELLPGFLRGTRLARWAVRRLEPPGPSPPSGRELSGRIAVERAKLALELADLVEAGREDGFEVLVLAVPHRGGLPSLYAWLAGVVPEGADLLDLHADPTWQGEAGRLFFPVDPHFTVEGNRLVAESIFEHLVGEGR